LNKVAGIYGLIALLTGAGGNAAQLTLYIYSALALVALTWGIRAVNNEDPKHMLYFAHIFFADHVLNTIWTVYFAVHWWLYTPHDGRRNANSPAQQ
ncbi:Inositolphosphorylceramide synthase subunit Kei1-domain-containing protein, partial [Russula earlei]